LCLPGREDLLLQGLEIVEVLANRRLCGVGIARLDGAHHIEMLGDCLSPYGWREVQMGYRLIHRVERENEGIEHPVAAGRGDRGVEVDVELGHLWIVRG